MNGQPGDEPVGDGGTINGVSQARCAFMPATDSTLPERRRRRRRSQSQSQDQNQVRDQVRGQERDLLGRNPGGQLDQPVIPENNTCFWEGDDRYAAFDLKRGKGYRLRLINAGVCLL